MKLLRFLHFLQPMPHFRHFLKPSPDRYNRRLRQWFLTDNSNTVLVKNIELYGQFTGNTGV